MKYLGRNLTTYVQDLYADNYKTLVRETAEERNKWRADRIYELEDLFALRYLVAAKLSYRYNIIPNKSPTCFHFVGVREEKLTS